MLKTLFVLSKDIIIKKEYFVFLWREMPPIANTWYPFCLILFKIGRIVQERLLIFVSDKSDFSVWLEDLKVSKRARNDKKKSVALEPGKSGKYLLQSCDWKWGGDENYH